MSEAPPPTPDQAAATPAASNAWLKPVLELGPLLLFFVAYSVWNIYAATGVFMVTSVTSLTVTLVRERRWPVMLLVSTVLVLIFGGLTIWLHDDMFIKLKITVVNGLFCAALVGGLLLRKPLIKFAFGETIHLTEEGWNTLTRIWAGYFFTIAALNEVVWRNTSTDTWTKFKVFALPALMLVFVFVQAPVIAKHDLSERKID